MQVAKSGMHFLKNSRKSLSFDSDSNDGSSGLRVLFCINRLIDDDLSGFGNPRALKPFNNHICRQSSPNYDSPLSVGGTTSSMY